MLHTMSKNYDNVSIYIYTGLVPYDYLMCVQICDQKTQPIYI